MGKTILVEVEVVNVPLNYDFLLGHNWFYEMKTIAYSVFHVMHFPHQGKLVTINHLDYCTLYLWANANTNVSFYSHPPGSYASFGVGLFNESSLLGTFPLPPPDARHVAHMHMISSIGCSSIGSYDICIILDPWGFDSFRASMSLSSTELSYSTIQSTNVDPNLGLP